MVLSEQLSVSFVYLRLVLQKAAVHKDIRSCLLSFGWIFYRPVTALSKYTDYKVPFEEGRSLPLTVIAWRKALPKALNRASIW